jgi:hypothetical protein
LITVQVDAFGFIFGENGPIVTDGLPSNGSEQVVPYLQTLCSVSGAGCFDATGSVWILLDGVYDDVSSSPYLDVQYIRQALASSGSN